MRNDPEILERISAAPGVCGGKPCIRGMRIPVAVIIDSLAEGSSPDEVLHDYPGLTHEDIEAARVYAKLTS